MEYSNGMAYNGMRELKDGKNGLEVADEVGLRRHDFYKNPSGLSPSPLGSDWLIGNMTSSPAAESHSNSMSPTMRAGSNVDSSTSGIPSNLPYQQLHSPDLFPLTNTISNSNSNSDWVDPWAQFLHQPQQVGTSTNLNHNSYSGPYHPSTQLMNPKFNSHQTCQPNPYLISSNSPTHQPKTSNQSSFSESISPSTPTSKSLSKAKSKEIKSRTRIACLPCRSAKRKCLPQENQEEGTGICLACQKRKLKEQECRYEGTDRVKALNGHEDYPMDWGNGDDGTEGLDGRKRSDPFANLPNPLLASNTIQLKRKDPNKVINRSTSMDFPDLSLSNFRADSYAADLERARRKSTAEKERVVSRTSKTESSK